MEKMITVGELASLLGVPSSWIYERTRKGGREGIPHTRLGKYIRFSPEQVREFLEKHRSGAPEPRVEHAPIVTDSGRRSESWYTRSAQIANRRR
jgi:excisionase family DNA binding protein